nr:immunoglobulin heavy chain junction region [Macaca mulatta]MOV41154.1 immunoglobulin heavy chain junction region [Macaca mulatta]MOV44140.1 immunoglobulin heavy chain junction region [Macaca mulatta]MOV45010.1 immunoglobulin heavy chain junction region [Macaca mulatta]
CAREWEIQLHLIFFDFW